MRKRLGAPLRLAYGPTPVEQLDIYKTKAANASIMIFIHGGEWRMGDAAGNAFAAELFINAGAHFIAPDFINVMQSGGDPTPRVEQIQRAVRRKAVLEPRLGYHITCKTIFIPRGFKVNSEH